MTTYSRRSTSGLVTRVAAQYKTSLFLGRSPSVSCAAGLSWFVSGGINHELNCWSSEQSEAWLDRKGLWEEDSLQISHTKG